MIYLVINRNISIFARWNDINKTTFMKYKEFHRKIVAAGWKFDHAEGSHYFYIKNGQLSVPVPYHGSKEIPEPLRKKIAKQMGI